MFLLLPKQFTLHYHTTLPIVHQRIDIDRVFFGLDPSPLLQQFGMKQTFAFHPGLDLAGGTSITLRANMHDIPSSERDNALESAKSVIERRVNFFGVSEPLVQTAKVDGDYRVLVEIPGVQNVAAAIQLIGTTAQMTFWEGSASGSATTASAAASPLGLTQVIPSPKKTDLTGKDLKASSVVFDPNTGAPQVQLQFTSDGAQKFASITRRNVGKPVAIVIDNIVISAPVVQQVIPDGNAVINGSFTQQQAKDLSIQLNAGALPVTLSVLSQQTIGATLGEDSLRKSLFAGVLGFVVIAIFMIVHYRKLGVLATVALVLYAIYTLVLFKLFGITLTLAGIAGFILSIGMAVDANILIFERMREELRAGKTFPTAIDLGFKRAWTSIRDSNISSIITSLILIYFGTGIVRGFALTLLIGVLVSMFSAVVITRTFLRLLYEREGVYKR